MLDSREVEANTRRRRICRACEHRWSTLEISIEEHDRMQERETAITTLLAKL